MTENHELNHPDSLKHKHYSDEPGELFNEIKELEERYLFIINTTRKQIEDEIRAKQIVAGSEYKHKIAEKREQLELEYKSRQSEIYVRIAALNKQDSEIIKEINEIMKKNEKRLIDEIISMVGQGIDFK